MTEYIIEKNVPLTIKKGGAKSKYPFGDMEVGDSFFIEKPPRNKRGYCQNVAQYGNKKYPNKKFTQREENNGLRVWRIK